jgi:GNAT superfamily N-acetyltransferase
MLLATPELARRVERAEIDFCAAASGAGLPDGAASIEVAGGRGLCGAAGAPFNKVLGLGVGAAVEDADLDAIEAFYDERGIPVQIELCPLAVSGLAARLTRRGYQLAGFENQLARTLGSERVGEPDGVRVTLASADTNALWLRVVAEGFAAAEGASAPPPAPDVVERLGEAMGQFLHSDYQRIIAWIGDEPAGAGSAYVQDGVLGIAGTATVPAFRRRGAHHALVASALNRALGRADLAMTTTEPGTTSQRTFERFGFQVIYTRAIFVLT